MEEIDSKEIKELFSYFSKRLEFLSTYFYVEKLNSLNQLLVSLRKQGIFSKIIQEAYKNPSFIDECIDEDPFKELVTSLFKFVKALDCYDKAASLMDKEGFSIQQKVKQIKKMRNPIRRFFTLPQKKNIANKCFAYLKENRNGSFITQADAIMTSFNLAQTSTYAAIKQDFLKNRNSYEKALRMYDETFFKSNIIDYSFDRIANELVQIDGAQKKLLTVYNDRIKEILNFLNTIVNHKVEEGMKNAPLEVLKNYKYRIRPILLYNEGYTNLYQVSIAPDYRLSSIYGISANTVRIIKNICNQYSNSLRSKIHLKLSLDNQGTEETLLVLSLYNLLPLYCLKKTLEGFLHSYQGILEQEAKKDKDWQLGLVWFFSSSQEISEFKASYLKAIDLYEQKFAPVLKNIEGALETKVEEDSQNAWRAFGKDPIAFNALLEEIDPSLFGGDSAYYDSEESFQKEELNHKEATFKRMDTSNPFETSNLPGSERVDKYSTSFISPFEKRDKQQRENSLKDQEDSKFERGFDPIDFSKMYHTDEEETLKKNNEYVLGLPKVLAKEVREQPLDLTGLNCSLRKYQEMGVKYILHQKKVLLGDEMGLGKTIEAIAAMVDLRNHGATHFMVVCPLAVLNNWCREIRTKSDLKVVSLYGYQKEEYFKYWKENGGVAVTNYDSLKSLSFDFNDTYSLFVVDEAHFIKHTETQRSLACIHFARRFENVLFMTGTALENNVGEMLTLIGILKPSIVQALAFYAYRGFSNMFQNMASQVYYRRKREDVLTELPDKVENEIWCKLSPEEETAYENDILDRNFMSGRRVSWNIPDLKRSCKAAALFRIIEDATQEERKILIFSFFLDTLNKIKMFLGNRVIGEINGSLSSEKRQKLIDAFDAAPSGKVLLCQITSGGVGLNIQAASVVVICEPQFKPSTEDQAISRAYRMGQARKVLVYRLLCQDTLDEKFVERLKEKRKIFGEYADKSSAGQLSLLDIKSEDMNKINQEEYERIRKKRERNTILYTS